MATFTVKDSTTVRNDYLRTVKNGLVARGVANPQVGPGSDYFVQATAAANEFAVVGANTQIKADAQMPDTATGSDLDRIAAMFGLSRGAASGSEGFITLTTTASTFIAAGTQLIDQVGLKYQVTTGATYTNTYPNNVIPITSVDKGRHTNHPHDDVFRWVSAPPYAAPTVTVGTPGQTDALTGGLNAELDTDLRARLLSRLQNPPNNANWNQIATIAEASDSSVQKAFVYPAVNGPSTVHIAVTGSPQVLTDSLTTLTSTSKTRVVSSAIITGNVTPYIQGQLPEYVESIITATVDETNDVAIQLSLPASPAAVPAGPGGGWIDGTPWPRNALSVSDFRCTVTALDGTDPTRVFTVDCAAEPVNNVSHICFLDPSNWQLYRAKVLSHTGSAAAWIVTLDTPFPHVAVGSFIMPDAVNMQTYCDAVLAAFGELGPGEKIDASNSAITRGYRHPAPASSWPYTLNTHMLRAIEDTGTEVLSTAWSYRQNTGNPTLPGTVADPPYVFTPANIAFYPLV